MKSATLGTSLDSIGDDAFESCQSLEEIVIPDNVRHIGHSAFFSCEKLTKVTIGKNVRKIGCAFTLYTDNIQEIIWNAIELDTEYEFYSSSMGFIFSGDINTLIIGPEVKMLPARFCSGKNLKEVTIPASVQSIDYQCFSCENLKTVTCESSTPPALGDFWPFEIPDEATLRVPCGSRQAYKKSAWKNYFSKFEEYFPYSVSISSEDETMGTTVMGDFDCSAGSVLINAQPNTGFVFVSWSDGNTEASRTLQVTSDTTLVASFKVQTFQIQFVDWDNTLLLASEVNYNTLPVAPTEPSRPATAQYTYTFKAWKPEIVAALADVTYKADYDSVLNKYLISFLNEDGSLIEAKEWAYGETPACTEPTKENTDKFAYHFDGWNPEIAPVTGDATYRAVFRAVPVYTLTFLDWNGDELAVVKAEEGAEADAPANPTRPGYEFAGWSRDLTAVNKDQYVIAMYNTVQDGITVLYKNQKDQLMADEVVGLTLPVIPDEQQPVFVGWFVEAGNINDGIVIRAHFADDPTALPQNNAPADQPRKIIKNQRLYIVLPDGTTYSVTGQEVK
jgi:uncharacterized repeat protein (TIGR02543 family)